MAQGEGPFKVLEGTGNNAYKLEFWGMWAPLLMWIT